MMANSKLKITHENDKIYFQFIGSNCFKTGYIDYTDDLWQMANSKKWRTDGKYIYSGKDTLHKIIMQYWYGEECYRKMRENNFVVDHIDNDGFNNLYENLEFLNRNKNWTYKGCYYDNKRKNIMNRAAVNIVKKRSGDKFQIAVGFNTPFYDPRWLPISRAYFAYDTSDYDLVLSDAVMLVESIEKGKIIINNLRFNRKKVIPLYMVNLDNKNINSGLININDEWFMITGNGFQFYSIPPDDTLW